MRGKVVHVYRLAVLQRITPAHAGKRHFADIPKVSPGDHPRACGEKIEVGFRCDTTVGSPPRMRGKAARTSSISACVRITPAHAGKSKISRSRAPGYMDHPRACGEKFNPSPRSARALGSPPRMRGKDPRRSKKLMGGGITPAHAGKSGSSHWFKRREADHPRACGEKSAGAAEHLPRLGSPPRMRGKANLQIIADYFGGITPAHAGKRHQKQGRVPSAWDHPRACGEKFIRSLLSCCN